MKSSECGGELMLRQRRGACSATELEAARRHLASCDSCRMLQLIGADFEDEGLLEPQDDERIRRYVELSAVTARGAYGRAPVIPRLGRLPRWALQLAAAVALLGAGAAGAQWWSGLRTPAVTVATTPVRWSAPKAAAPAVRAPIPAEQAAPRLASPSAALDGSATAAVSGPSQAPRFVVPESASLLFAKANDARRAGDTAAAAVLYRQLQASFPSSAESRLSHVSLGRLLLDSGSPVTALQQFDRYSSAPGGELRLEALYGRAKALVALGRAVEEQRAWQQLLKEFPASVYAERARKRLGELR